MSTALAPAHLFTTTRNRRGSAMVVVFVVALVALGCVFLMWEVTKTYDYKSGQEVKEGNTIHAVSELVDWLKARRTYRYYFYIGTQTWTWDDDKNNNEVADFTEGTIWQPTSEYDTNNNGIPDFGEPGVNPVKWGDSEVFIWTRLLPEAKSGDHTKGHAQFQYICGARSWHKAPDGTFYPVQEMADIRRMYRQNVAEVDAALMLQVNGGANGSQKDYVVDTTLSGTGSAGDKVNGLDHDLTGTLNNSGNNKYGISLNDGWDLGLTLNGGASVTGSPGAVTDSRADSSESLNALIEAIEDMTPNPLVLDEHGIKLDNADGTFGTADNWKVTRIDATKGGGSISMASQTVGYGILLIEYDNLADVDVKFSGGSSWKGIVLVVGNGSGAVQANGGLDISGSPGKETRLLGSTIFYARNNDKQGVSLDGAVKIAGTPTVEYSAEAVARALQPVPPTDKMNFRLLTTHEAHPNTVDRGTMTADLKTASDNGYLPLGTSSTTLSGNSTIETIGSSGTTSTTGGTGGSTGSSGGSSGSSGGSSGSSGSNGKGASKKP